jgi:anthranilate phosphoribosyltransferase
MEQELLEELLKKKGIGPEGSKSLKGEELARLIDLLLNKKVSLTTKATMLTALLTLIPTDLEKEWIDKVKRNPSQYLPSELVEFILPSTHPFLSLIKKVIEHNELTEEEAKFGMTYLLDPQTPDYLKASFLEAERLKRESFNENKIFFQCLFSSANRIETTQFPIIDICDNYDGSNRSYNFSIFTAAVLAAIGYKVVLHGVDRVAPKQGFTTHQILNCAGKNPCISLGQAKQQLEEAHIGWAYVDQSISFPTLYQFKKMRKEMVKRPFLATFEKLLQPIHSTKGNYIVTGYTHPHYKQEVVNQLKHQGKSAKAIVIKGVEGSSHMSLSKETSCVIFNGTSIHEAKLTPELYGLHTLEQKIDKTISAEDSFIEGVKALRGERNYARENILYLASVILDTFELKTKEEIVGHLSAAIDSGKAVEHWENGNRF